MAQPSLFSGRSFVAISEQRHLAAKLVGDLPIFFPFFLSSTPPWKPLSFSFYFLKKRMHTASVHRRNLVLVVVILTVLFSLTYYRHAAYRPISLSSLEKQTPPSEEPVKPEAANHGNDRGITEIPKEPTACDAVDAHWL